MTALNPSVRLVKSQNLPNPNKYVEMMRGELSDWVVSEDKAPPKKGQWRGFLGLSDEMPLDLEIGTGNGFFFADYGKAQPERALLGMELKFKPLVQSMRRSLALGNRNTRMVRYHAGLLDEVFGPQEINRVFIYFPDPWPKKKHHKNRLVTLEFLTSLFDLQRSGSFVEIKTDFEPYFDWILARALSSPYKVTRESRDLQQSEWAADNYSTHFEKLWMSKGLRTHLLRLEK